MTNSIKLTDIKKEVKAEGGEYSKCNFYLNGNDAYKITLNDIEITYTKPDMIEQYKIGFPRHYS